LLTPGYFLPPLRGFKNQAALTCISRQISTAEADPGMSTALLSVGLLNILSSMSAGLSVALAEMLPDAPCIHARLRLLATKPGEKCGLGECFMTPSDDLEQIPNIGPFSLDPEIGRVAAY
jgi:hypothetical protein